MHGPTVEGAYLSGYGVVFTVALPATDRNPLPGSGTPKSAPAMTEWEREQRRLRGEPLPERTGVVTSKPSVGDILLKLLAENGKHFTSLKDDERVTIAVTFRAVSNQAKPVTFTTLPDKPPLNVETISGTLKLSGAGPLAIVDQSQSVRDLELLGDLHLKQGEPQAAIEAFRKALSLAEKEVAQAPADQDARNRLLGTLRKLAQANLAAGKDDEARALMAKTATLESKPMTVNLAPKPAAAVRPARLTISASKKLLDQVGNGKISLDEFRKQAMVEYSSTGKATGE
jgi:hypothetical protein